MAELSILEAVRSALDFELGRDPRVVLLGEDVGGSGGVFRATEGLQAKYTIDTLATFLRAPQPPMPAYPFSDDQRRELAIWLLASHP